MKPTHLMGASLVVLAIATGANAAVTAEQTWADWQTMMERWGATVAFDGTSREGDALVVRNLRIVTDRDGTRSQTQMDRLSLRELGDGRVEMTNAPVSRIESTSAVEGEDPVHARFRLTEQEARTIASGTPGAVRYDYTAASVLLDGMEATDAEGEPLPFDIAFEVRDITGTLEEGATGSADAATARVRFEGTTPGEEGTPGVRQMMERTFDTVSFEMKGQPSPGPMGFTGRWSAAYVSSDWTMDVAKDGRSVRGTGTSGAGTISANAADGRQALDGTETDSTFHIEVPDLAAPIDVQAEQTIWSFGMPAGMPQTEEAFDAALNLRDVTASDGTWALLDPNGQLPRDPMDLALTLSGTAAPGEASGVDLRHLVLEDLHLDALGAVLAGTGEASFLPSAPPAADGTPTPPALERGTLDLTLKGGTGLIDALTAAGLIPQEQAMGARMMLGMFGRPVDGQPDTVATTIETGPDGLTVNGQRLQ